MGNGNGPLGTPRDKKGKGCHDLSRRWEAMPRSPLTFRSLATISLGVLNRFRTPKVRLPFVFCRRRSTAEEHRSTVTTVDREVVAVDRWQFLRYSLFPQTDELL